MRQLITTVGSGMLVLLILPVAVWCSGWQWQPHSSQPALPFLYAMTQTVTRPWGVVSTLVLGVALLSYLRRQGAGRTELLKAALLIVAVVWGGQGINTLIKHQVKEPRPYAVWMQQVTGTPTTDFYQQPTAERRQWVIQVTAGYPQLPGFLKQHWEEETGYAFPSGHSMFAACWALLILALVKPTRHRWVVGVVFGWAIMVMWSRMAMGMHWPRDVIMSISVAAVWVCLLCWLLKMPVRRP
ncbi:phosphatase PAP2 family protein [Tatumella saanichensis]|uniref:phosphatase PAP2 family protein n=1 Tax=Tatumella saanichensis TaxID=480813 RepID=UPI0004BC6B71|nr:phosphatase PAP2 family protein [Tatumella saanichensis]